MSSSVGQIIESVQDKARNDRSPSRTSKPAFMVKWAPLQVLTLLVPNTDRTLHLQINATNQHVRKFSMQFVSPNGFSQPIPVPVFTNPEGVVEMGDTFEAVKALLESGQKFIMDEAIKDIKKQEEFEKRKNSPPASVTPKPNGTPGGIAVRALGKTAKKRAKEAARKAG